MPRSTTASRTRRNDEDEYYDGPSSRTSEDEDLDEPVSARTRRASRRDEDAEDRPAQRGRSRDDDDDARPSRSRSRSRRDDDDNARPDTPRSRSRREDSDKDDQETRRARRSEGTREATSTSMGRGRQGLRDHRATHKSGFPDKLTVREDTRYLIKFLDDDFFITFYEHNLYNDFKGQKRQMSFVCLGKDCPLCEIGDSPGFKALINVVDLTNPRKPELKVWYATPGPGGLIEDEMDALEEKGRERFPDDEDKWPQISDDNLYYVVSKKKSKNGFFEYALKQVKARDLEEDGYGEPLSAEELADFEGKRHTDEVVRINTRRDLLDIADELSE